MSERLPVARTRAVVLGTLSSAERSRVTDQLHELWSEYFTGMDKADFVRTHFSDHTHLVLSFGRGGDLAGFANINPYRLRAAGREHLVLTSGFFNRLEYRGSARTAGRCIVETLKIVARNPRLPLAGVAVATSPLSYNFAGRMISRFYPHPDHQAPPEVPQLLEELARVRGIPFDHGDPWMVDFPVQVVDAERLDRSETLKRGSRWISWYQERAPDWRRGRVVNLWVPITVRGLLDMGWKLARS